MLIDQNNKFYKTWKEDKGWRVRHLFALPRITRKGNLGHKWQKETEKRFKREPEAEYYFNITKKELEVKHLNKEIVKYRISKQHIVCLKTFCPNCGRDADILTCILMVGTGLHPQAPIVCPHCAEDHPLLNTVGTYYYKNDSEFIDKKEGEREYFENRIIITKEHYLKNRITDNNVNA